MYVYAVLSGCWSALSCSKEGTERSVTGIALYSHSAFWRSLCFCGPCEPLLDRTSGHPHRSETCRSELTKPPDDYAVLLPQHVCAAPADLP